MRSRSSLAEDDLPPRQIDGLIKDAVFATEPDARASARRAIRDAAAAHGVLPASIHGLYLAAGRGLYRNVTVPAINLRGITYEVARAVFRAALKDRVGAFIFEIARSEIDYTRQEPAEFATSVLAAALREGFRGPVFIQGDHFQVSRSRYLADPKAEPGAIGQLIRESVDAGFFNIDIDASTLVDLDVSSPADQQAQNCLVTAEFTGLIRSIEPDGVTISIGGEIGEIGGGNSTVADLEAFMTGYRSLVPHGLTTINKVSVQTGTTHGGVVLPDGSIADAKLDFETLKELSRVAREEYGLGGAVQHGASTLPDEAFDMFPETGTLEVHLATGFQNIIFDSPHFPRSLLDDINGHLAERYAAERKPGETTEQLLYKTRKRAFGDFKRELWELPEDVLAAIGEELEERFSFIFRQLNVVNTVGLVAEQVTVPITS